MTSTTNDLVHLLYDLASEAAMRAATWISTQTGLFEGHPEYILILLAIFAAVWIRLS